MKILNISFSIMNSGDIDMQELYKKNIFHADINAKQKNKMLFKIKQINSFILYFNKRHFRQNHIFYFSNI